MTRPEVNAGPMDRISNPLKVGDDIGSAASCLLPPRLVSLLRPALQLPGTPAVWPQLPGALSRPQIFLPLFRPAQTPRWQ